MAALKSLAILQTNQDEPKIAERFPPDGIKFRQLLQPVMAEATFDIYDTVSQEYPEDLSAYSAFLITGSPSSVTDDEPWIHKLLEIIVELHALRIPTIGVCFGHQAVAAALGGKVERAKKGWNLGIKPLHFGAEPWMQPQPQPQPEPQPESLKLIHIHQDQVTELPPNARLLAGNDSCPYASFTIGDHILTVQGHPEFDRAFLEGVLQFYKDIFPAEARKQAAASAGDTNHGAVFAQWIANFLKQSGESAMPFDSQLDSQPPKTNSIPLSSVGQ